MLDRVDRDATVRELTASDAGPARGLGAYADAQNRPRLASPTRSIRYDRS